MGASNSDSPQSPNTSVIACAEGGQVKPSAHDQAIIDQFARFLALRGKAKRVASLQGVDPTSDMAKAREVCKVFEDQCVMLEVMQGELEEAKRDHEAQAALIQRYEDLLRDGRVDPDGVRMRLVKADEERDIERNSRANTEDAFYRLVELLTRPTEQPAGGYHPEVNRILAASLERPFCPAPCKHVSCTTVRARKGA